MKKKTNTKTNKASHNKTNKRGRPPKAFISKKPQIKREGPGRPKKIEKVTLPEIPEKKDNKIKDAIILIIFIVSFFVFGFSIYVSQKEKITTLLQKTTETTEITVPTTNENKTGTEQPITLEQSQQESVIVQDSKVIIIEQIYSAIEQFMFDDLYMRIDNSLKKSSIFKTYFSKSRLQRFINNIDNKNLTIELIKIDNETAKITYKVSYAIKNIPFNEEREASFITKNEEQKIAKIMCITQGCSTMPFFNPGKYF